MSDTIERFEPVTKCSEELWESEQAFYASAMELATRYQEVGRAQEAVEYYFVAAALMERQGQHPREIYKTILMLDNDNSLAASRLEPDATRKARAAIFVQHVLSRHTPEQIQSVLIDERARNFVTPPRGEQQSCPDCGMGVPPGSSVCEMCGASLAEPLPEERSAPKRKETPARGVIPSSYPSPARPSAAQAPSQAKGAAVKASAPSRSVESGSTEPSGTEPNSQPFKVVGRKSRETVDRGLEPLLPRTRTESFGVKTLQKTQTLPRGVKPLDSSSVHPKTAEKAFSSSGISMEKWEIDYAHETPMEERIQKLDAGAQPSKRRKTSDYGVLSAKDLEGAGFTAKGAEPPTPFLIQIDPQGEEVCFHPFESRKTVVGQEEHCVGSNHPDAALEPEHAVFSYNDTSFHVTDLGSRTGVYLKVEERAVCEAGQVFQVGSHTFRVEPVSKKSSASRIIHLGLDGQPIAIFRIASQRFSIGREGNDLDLPQDPYLSARHVELLRIEGGFELRDQGSKWGTYLRLPAEADLPPKTVVRVGRLLFKVDLR